MKIMNKEIAPKISLSTILLMIIIWMLIYIICKTLSFYWFIERTDKHVISIEQHVISIEQHIIWIEKQLEMDLK